MYIFTQFSAEFKRVQSSPVQLEITKLQITGKLYKL